MEEQLDRYTRGLESYIWKDSCTNDNNDHSETMENAEVIEAANCRSRIIKKAVYLNNLTNNSNGGTQKPIPMEIGYVELKKFMQKRKGTRWEIESTELI